MPVRKCMMLAVLLLGLLTVMTACTPKSYGIIRASRGYDAVFTATLAAIQEAEFTVTSQEPRKGAIVAEKRLPRNEGDTLRMTVQIEPSAAGSTVIATVAPSSGVLAPGEKPCKCHVKRFVAALEARMPEVQVVDIQ